MRVSAFFVYLFFVSLLTFCVVLMIKNKQYISSFEFSYFQESEGDEQLENIPYQNQKSDCKFGFGFLRKLIMKPKVNSRVDSDVHLSERPISGALIQGSICADSMDGVEGEAVSLGPCHGQGRNQEWTLTKTQLIRSEGRGFLCLAWNAKKMKNIFLQKCNAGIQKQKWLFNGASGKFVAATNPKLCLENHEGKLQLSKCENIQRQKWNVTMTEILNIQLQARNNN